MLNQYCPLCNKDLSSFKTKLKLLKEKVLYLNCNYLKYNYLKYNPIEYVCYDCELTFSICNINSEFRVSSFFSDSNKYEYCYSVFKDGKCSFPIWFEQVIQIDAFVYIPKRIIELNSDISLQEAAKIIKRYKENLLFL
jgi:hypothetical protein